VPPALEIAEPVPAPEQPAELWDATLPPSAVVLSRSSRAPPRA
jgi:hypothetical protein